MRALTHDITFPARPRPESFLGAIAFGAVALVVSARTALLLRSEAAATASNVLASEHAGRLGLVANLIGAAVYGVLTFLLHFASQPIRSSQSLVGAYFHLAREVLAAGGLTLSLAPVLLRAGEHALMDAVHLLLRHLF